MCPAKPSTGAHNTRFCWCKTLFFQHNLLHQLANLLGFALQNQCRYLVLQQQNRVLYAPRILFLKLNNKRILGPRAGFLITICPTKPSSAGIYKTIITRYNGPCGLFICNNLLEEWAPDAYSFANFTTRYWWRGLAQSSLKNRSYAE